MSESYKTHSDGLYFVSFSVVGPRTREVPTSWVSNL